MDSPPAKASDADLANSIRALAMDAVEAAKSGHPGMPMGMAEIAVALWKRHLRHNPANPAWPNRDRFVLSNGHGLMLLYSLLHLTGYALPIDELKRFRQLGSKTAGHPEYGYAPGVETTTGPLGQGIANGVGMALTEKLLAAQFNRPEFDLVDHYTYVFMGDGCMMEGLSHEVCAFAGTLGLGKLIAFYDDNGISIDSEKGAIRDWYTDDVPKRFAAYNWQVIPNVDGHDVEAVDRAIRKAKREKDRPTLICCKTVIAKGAPKKANTGAAHGAPLGPEEIAATRQAIGWPYPPFEVPSNVYEAWDAKEAGKRAERRWNRSFKDYEKQFPADAAELTRRVAGKLPEAFGGNLKALIEDLNAKAETIATRKASQNVLEALTPGLPELLGGSADLTGSNLTMVKASKPVSPACVAGNHIFYGVREFGMCAIMNGITLHGGFVPYGGTFLVFSDYARNALRMAALMKIRVVYVFTHDSIGLGEDGPTHQPVEHAATLRLIPNMDVWRPCDTVETAIAWAMAIERHDGPSCLALSRQNAPFVQRDQGAIAAIRRGGYVLADAANARAAILATGTEVSIALAARETLAGLGIPVRVVSMPCTSLFDRQDADWRAAVLPKGMPRVAIEAGVTDFWRKYVGLEGGVIGIDRFGESAPAPDVYKFLGVDAEHLVAAVQALA